jgi:hypothetical protein
MAALKDTYIPEIKNGLVVPKSKTKEKLVLKEVDIKKMIKGATYIVKQQNETKFRLRILFKDGIRLPKTETRKATIAVLTNAENSIMTKQGPVFTAAERNSLGLKQGTKATYTLKDFVGNKFNKVTPFGMGLAQAETVTQEKLMPQILEEDGESNVFETLTNKIFKPAPTAQPIKQPSTQPSTSVKIEPTDKIIFGHPGIGKTELRKNGRTGFRIIMILNKSYTSFEFCFRYYPITLWH